MGGSKLPYSLGPFYLLAPIALMGLLWPRSRLLALAALVLSAAYVGNKDARFLMPALPFVFLAVGYVFSRARRAGALALGALSLAQIALCWPPVVKRIHTPRGDYFAGSSWKIASRRQPEDDYLRLEGGRISHGSPD